MVYISIEEEHGMTNKNNNLFIGIAALSFFVVPTVGLCEASNLTSQSIADSFNTISPYVMLLFAVLIVFCVYKAVTIQSAYNKLKGSLNDNGYLYVKERGKMWSALLKIVAVKNTYLGYEPKKLHFGAATVGGVTSGGFYTTGGYNKVVGETKTNKYTLQFDGKIVSSIRLSSSLYQQAKHSPIGKYLDESTMCIEVFNKVHRTKEETDALLENAMKLATGAALTSGMAIDDWRGFPSKEKCKEIYNWLCEEQQILSKISLR